MTRVFPTTAREPGRGKGGRGSRWPAGTVLPAVHLEAGSGQAPRAPVTQPAPATVGTRRPAPGLPGERGCVQTPERSESTARLFTLVRIPVLPSFSRGHTRTAAVASLKSLRLKCAVNVASRFAFHHKTRASVSACWHRASPFALPVTSVSVSPSYQGHDSPLLP